MQAMTGTGYVASFLGREPGKALFVGLYSIGGSKPLTREEFWRVPAYVKLKAFGMRGFADERATASALWFNLALTDFYAHWKGKLIVGWPPPERSWWRRAHRNEIPVLSVLEDSALDAAMKEWNEIEFTWESFGSFRRAGGRSSTKGGVFTSYSTLAMGRAMSVPPTAKVTFSGDG